MSTKEKNKFNKRAHSAEKQVKNKPYQTLNLSDLLDKKIIPSPQAIMNNRLFTQRSVKNTDSLQIQFKTQNQTKSYRRIPLKINYQHYRSRSSSTIKNYYNQINSLNQPQTKLNKLTDSRKKVIFQQQNNIDKSPNVKGFSLENSYKSQQLSYNNSLKNQNYAFRQELYASNKIKRSQVILLMSCQYNSKTKDMQYPNKLSSIKQITNKKFLKKGSSLQKQIVSNLLKNKIIKEHQSNLKKQYTENDILGMIKLYKGFSSFPNSSTKNLRPDVKAKVKTRPNIKDQNQQFINDKYLETDQSLPERIVGKNSRPIIGWQTKQQFDIEELKNRPISEITMDNSGGFQ